MKIIKVENIPHLNNVPLESILIEKPKLIIDLDDINEQRFRLEFSPYQAIKVTTIDCFDVPESMGIMQKNVMEVIGSEWMQDLKKSLKQIDSTANFMDKARHFIIPFYDDVLEVVAWDITVSFRGNRERSYFLDGLLKKWST